MIPAEIIVTLLICYLVFKIVIWWTRAQNMRDENIRLDAENVRLKSDLAVLADKVTDAPSRMPTTKQTRRPQVGDDLPR